MALAPGHRLGQIIGEMFELAVEPPLASFCAEHGLYLDGKRPRKARPGVKVVWEDDLGNKHELDHVIERGGSEEESGIPAAFIETAWRRYTKHSKAKAQEMQAAVLPLLAKWSHVKPFAGVMLAGEFTPNSLQQLQSNGFAVLHISTQTIVDVFAAFGMDVSAEESTSDAHLQQQVDRYDALSSRQKLAVGQALRDAARDEIQGFIHSLSTAILRGIESISILPLHGATTSAGSVSAAVQILRSYTPPDKNAALVRFEVVVRYDNGDNVVADFASAADATTFLRSFD
jgi:hypothetical protein